MTGVAEAALPHPARKSGESGRMECVCVGGGVGKGGGTLPPKNHFDLKSEGDRTEPAYLCLP